MIKRFSVALLMVLMVACSTSDSPDPDPLPPGPLPVPASPSSETGSGGAAATVDAFASQAALEILEAGGNAIDAAIAAAAVINVTNPFSAGIGGGGFMVIYLADENRVLTIDGREAAPAAATPDMFLEDGSPIPFLQRVTSGLSVGVPGTLASWQLAQSQYGTMNLATVLEPAITVAERGFPITSTFAQQAASNRERFANFPSTAALFLTEDGEAPEEGSIHRNPDLAATLRLIGQQGVDVFYSGEIAEDIVAMVQNPQTIDEPSFPIRSQNMVLADLAAYTAIEREATQSSYRGFEVFGMGPPSSGGLTISLILNILEDYDLGNLPEEEALHLMIEASRLAYSDRGVFMADSDFVDVPVAGLLSKDFAATRRALISDSAGLSPEPGDPCAFQDGPCIDIVNAAGDTPSISTTHLTVSDAAGNVVSYTYTIETIGGSGMVVPGRGFLLNNELTDFNATPGTANSVEPGKRPRSSMSPTIVLRDGQPAFAVGSPGGATIITTVMQILLNVIDFDMTLPEAINASRLSQRNLGSGATTREPDLAEEIIAALEARGHTFTTSNEIGAATGIFFHADGSVTAAAEAVRRGSGTARVQNPQ